MKKISEEEINNLSVIARKVRVYIIKMLTRAQSGHTAGSLGMVDIFTALYFKILNYDPKKPNWEERDRLILSNGHICPVQYACMALAGYFSEKELFTLRKFASRLQGHPERTCLPGLETTSGPLGSGLGQAAGIAFAAKMDNKNFHIYCLMSDAEQQAGNTWESVMFISKYRLNNVTAVIDRNNIQISGKINNVMPIEPLVKKYQAFNWNVLEIDGHDFLQIITSFEKARKNKKPTVIIAHTIAGKGVKDIEGDYNWHGKVPDKYESQLFIQQLQNL